MYKKVGKRLMDIFLTLAGIFVLSPVFFLIALLLKLDSPGPIFFKQKRVGKNKRLFSIYKFRTMSIHTPKDTPTHLLDRPEQYITRMGHFLRKSSLDELPQLFNILKGDMSLIGPRPALWNQADLVAERDRYQVHALRPGVTGWAQVNGRDELSIAEKARLDGEYADRISFFFDITCFVKTLICIVKSEGVVEGAAATDKERTLVPPKIPSSLPSATERTLK